VETTETVVYLQINNWTPPENQERFLSCYLEGSLTDWDVEYPEGVVCHTVDEEEQWMVDNKLCINNDVYDMSSHYWITTTKEWIEKNFPELLCDASETGKDWLYKNDRKYFLKYMPENYGIHFSTPICGLEGDIAEYLADGRFAFPELFENDKK